MKLAVLVLVCAAVAQTRADEKVVLEKKRLLYHASWTSFRGRHFHYFSSSMTWAEAESFCRSIGGNLASVKNSLENTKLLSLIKQKHGPTTSTPTGVPMSPTITLATRSA
uniref:C-type lectin domain-containing protein n=1 Tax=Oryzias sinensis TaxID=183150 RepID=A0A8C8A0D5_9TELE